MFFTVSCQQLPWVCSVFYVSDTFQVWGDGSHVRQIINIFLIHARFHGVLRFRHEFLQTAIPWWSTSKFWSRHELGMSLSFDHTYCMHAYIHTCMHTYRHTYIHIISYYNAYDSYDVTIRILDMDTVIQIHIKCMWKLSHWKPSVA